MGQLNTCEPCNAIKRHFKNDNSQHNDNKPSSQQIHNNNGIQNENNNHPMDNETNSSVDNNIKPLNNVSSLKHSNIQNLSNNTNISPLETPVSLKLNENIKNNDTLIKDPIKFLEKILINRPLFLKSLLF